MKKINNVKKNSKIRLTVILLISLFVILTGTLFSAKAFMSGDVAGGSLGIFIAISILTFALFVYVRGNRDMKMGYPLQDERSKRVLEKTSSTSFYVSLYLLLVIGFLSDKMIKFRDVSQATSTTVGGMALLYVIFWIYYNKKEI